MPELPAGTYDVSVTSPGFKKYTQHRINIVVAQMLRVDIVMKSGIANESVTVSGDASLLKTENAEHGYNIETDPNNSDTMAPLVEADEQISFGRVAVTDGMTSGSAPNSTSGKEG